jgi:hypothetical protein
MFVRKAILLVVFILVIGSELFAQKIIDSVKVCGLPVREGIVYEYNLD